MQRTTRHALLNDRGAGSPCWCAPSPTPSRHQQPPAMRRGVLCPLLLLALLPAHAAVAALPVSARSPDAAATRHKWKALTLESHVDMSRSASPLSCSHMEGALRWTADEATRLVCIFWVSIYSLITLFSAIQVAQSLDSCSEDADQRVPRLQSGCCCCRSF